MPSEEEIIQASQNVQNLLNSLIESSPDWYASLRIPALEFKRRLEIFKELKYE